MKNIIVLISGSGTNLKNLIDKLQKRQINIVKVISSNSEAKGLIYANDANIESVVIQRDNYTKDEFDKLLVNEIEKSNYDLVVLAGFMPILGNIFTSRVKAINLHPSLLPEFKGLNAIKRSYESSKSAGVTVHYVANKVDSGEIIEQKELIKIDNESYESFSRRMHDLEYELLPKSILKILK